MSVAFKPLAPGATLGVLGGGQLGRMWVHAAQSMGFQTQLSPLGTQRSFVASQQDQGSPFEYAGGSPIQLGFVGPDPTPQFESPCFERHAPTCAPIDRRLKHLKLPQARAV